MSNKEKVTPIRNIKQEAQDLLTERRITIADMSNELSQSMVGMTFYHNALRNHPTKISEKTGCEFDQIVVQAGLDSKASRSSPSGVHVEG